MTGRADAGRGGRTAELWFHGGQASAATAEPDCREAVELVTDYLDGVLEPPLAAAVERHLALCRPCVEYARQMRETARLLGQLPEEALSERAPAEPPSAGSSLPPPTRDVPLTVALRSAAHGSAPPRRPGGGRYSIGLSTWDGPVHGHVAAERM
jgi:anti-sigma factor RsiW